MEYIRALAMKAREDLGISGMEPIENMLNLLNKKENITIVKKKMQGNISGFCSKTEDVKAILINSKYSLGRQNFTLAHEYYHLKYDKNLSEYSTDKETEANIFASYFIMPKEALEFYLLEKNIPKKKDVLTEKDLLNLSVYFKISYTALLVRLEKEEKLISKTKREELKSINPRALAIQNGVFTDVYDSTNEDFSIVTDYVEEVETAHRQGKISFGKYESLLVEGGFEDVVYGFTENIGEVVDGRMEDYI